MDNIEWKISDPFVYQTLSGIIGSNVAVETCRGAVRGRLANVQPDHIVVELGRNSFFIRTAQIIWIVPNPDLVME
ncbi:YuzF family protein [Bacillus sp. FJAT-27245]|uniref:YuzF family protein n=1 Tax=Bacillus sp. FJAT-27245 TaxID=1684144 RepID=UPI001E2AC260|nr:YuzF family protein [Bacillus sp. FJAT-27245]